jgi:Fur family zinc uptake transcriptional regulator
VSAHRHAAAVAAFPRKHDHEACVSDAIDAAAALCARLGERFTPLRRRVLELVWSSHQPIGAYAILDKLREEGRAAAPPTVYRALDFLLAHVIVHRIASMNAYVGCQHPGEAHAVQFLICRSCGMAAEIHDPAMSEAVARSASRVGFTIENRVIELAGLCARCKENAPAAAS